MVGYDGQLIINPSSIGIYLHALTLVTFKNNRRFEIYKCPQSKRIHFFKNYSIYENNLYLLCCFNVNGKNII